MTVIAGNINGVFTQNTQQLLFAAPIDLVTGFNVAPSVAANNTPYFFEYYNTTNFFAITHVRCILISGIATGASGGITDTGSQNVIASGTSFGSIQNLGTMLSPALHSDVTTKSWSSLTGQADIQYVLGAPSNAACTIGIWVYGMILNKQAWS